MRQRFFLVSSVLFLNDSITLYWSATTTICVIPNLANKYDDNKNESIESGKNTTGGKLNIGKDKNRPNRLKKNGNAKTAKIRFVPRYCKNLELAEV